MTKSLGKRAFSDSLLERILGPVKNILLQAHRLIDPGASGMPHVLIP
ncbi:MAG: hypothetical protein GY864_11230 [Desulfobacterales bacterium]|nr:hypothetical protein [Desulfobacterales bacterium]